jgi:hypothetical protein
MPRKSLLLFASICFILIIASRQALADDPFAGSFTGAKISIDIVAAPNGYTGTIHYGQQSYPIKAEANGNSLSGTFSSGSSDFPFSATISGDNLSLTTAGTTYQLSRPAAAANPLAASAPPANPPPPNPLGGDAAANPPSAAPSAAAAPISAAAPDGYSTAAATAAGRAWVTQKQGITAVGDAIGATVADLSKFLGNNPTISGAFEDSKDNQSGGASFTATAGGQPIKGLIICQLANNTAKISVTYALASATPADWAALNTAARTPPPDPAIAAVHLTEFDFPDGTGSIGVADGWHVNSNSLVDPLNVTGPGGQTIGGGASIPIQSPDSTLVKQREQMQAQSDAQWRALGQQPRPPLPMPWIIAPLSPPDQALPVVFPQIYQMNLRQHRPTAQIDTITSVQDVPPVRKGCPAQILEYGVTRTTVDGVSSHYKCKVQWESDPVSSAAAGGPQGGWMLFTARSFSAPDATYDQDMITMQAMFRSMKMNWPQYMKVQNARFQAQLQANNQAFQQSIADQQKQNEARQEEFDEQNDQWAAQENAKSRAADDWIEYAGGYRTVIDTQTGEGAQVDLSNVTGIVSALNTSADDPNRYVQIPLRDIKDPVGEPER